MKRIIRSGNRKQHIPLSIPRVTAAIDSVSSRRSYLIPLLKKTEFERSESRLCLTVGIYKGRDNLNVTHINRADTPRPVQNAHPPTPQSSRPKTPRPPIHHAPRPLEHPPRPKNRHSHLPRNARHPRPLHGRARRDHGPGTCAESADERSARYEYYAGIGVQYG